jgi:hypothetical protein
MIEITCAGLHQHILEHEILDITSTSGQCSCSGLNIYDEGVLISSGTYGIDFVGPNITAEFDDISGRVIVTSTGIQYECSGLDIYDEGVLVMSGVQEINFIGVDVYSEDSNLPNRVNVYIPPPTFLSHWNTSDGTNGDQSVTDPTSRTSQRIATPSGGEGIPFRTNGWAATTQDATLSDTVTFTTPGDTTGFGGNSTFVVNIKNASDAIVETYTTPAITGNGVHTSPSGNIVVTITNYGVDASKWKAHASVAIDVGQVFTDIGESGGRYHAEANHITDSVTDGGQTFTYTQADVFIDTNPTTPSISGSVGIQERAGYVVTKHLSGIEYYTLGSQFIAQVSGIDQIMRNTAAVNSNLRVRGDDYGLSTLWQCPFGSGSGNFSGWTNNHDVDNIDWNYTGWAIGVGSYCFRGTTANIDATGRDGWAYGSLVNGPNASILVDTNSSSSTNTYDNFVDEDYRLESDYTTSWDPEKTLVSGEVLTQCSYIMVPDQSTLVGESTASVTDWSNYKPDKNGPNPDYTSLSVGTGCSFYRKFIPATSDYIANMTWVFSGTWKGVNALTDLINGDLELYIRKIDGIGNSGPTSPPLMAHGDAYNAGLFDDGNTNGQVRLGSSSGNTIQTTFGTFTMKDGIYVEFKIKDNSIKINSITVTF